MCDLNPKLRLCEVDKCYIAVGFLMTVPGYAPVNCPCNGPKGPIGL